MFTVEHAPQLKKSGLMQRPHISVIPNMRPNGYDIYSNRIL